MCGIVGIVGTSPVNQAIYDGLTVLQHRGQDAAGIITIENNTFSLRKANGLVKDVFHTRHMKRLQGTIGIGHVRYPTAGSSSSSEAQPFYVNSPFGIALAHNGNLTNAETLKQQLFSEARRHVNTTSDSEILLNIMAHELSKSDKLHLDAEDIFTAVTEVNNKVTGGYAAIAMIIGHGVLAFRDPYMFASESVALKPDGFEFVRDVAPGEAIYVTEDGQFHSQSCAEKASYAPCIFEFVYFARPDSTIDRMSVYATRVNMGTKLGEKIAREWSDKDIDVVIPIPETSCDVALEIARMLDLPYRQGFVKNRYIGRTFIMPGQEMRKKSVRQKLNAIDREFKGKNVLLVDDSIVRGTTSAQIVEMAREAGAKNVYFASAAPEIRFPNVYGIDMPSAAELIAHGREVEDINQSISADGLIFQSLNDLIAAVSQENPEITKFETSVFDGQYITGDIDQDYLNHIDQLRNDSAKSNRENAMSSGLEIHNQDANEAD